MKKIHCLLMFALAGLDRRPLYQWLLIGEGGRSGSARVDEYKDKTKCAERKIARAVLKKLLGDDYSASVEDEIAALEAAVGASVYDIFDDHPIFARFSRLRGLARNREFEIMYYGKVR